MTRYYYKGMAPAMFETYLRLYNHYVTHYGPSTAIFLLVGSFYELYDIRDKSGEGQTSFDKATTIMGIQKVPKGTESPICGRISAQ